MLQPCRRDCAAMRMFSRVVALGRMLVIWYEREMPLREMRSGESPVMSSPLNRMRPDEGRSTPVRQLKNVLLPAPFGPITARISPRGSSKLMALSGATPPKRMPRSSVRSTGGEAPAPADSAGASATDEGSAATSDEANLQDGGNSVLP